MMEEILKMAVNYGLGIVFSIGIAVAFFGHLRDDKKRCNEREDKLMAFLETHMVTMNKTLIDHIEENKRAQSYQRDEHKEIKGLIQSIKCQGG